MSFCPSGAVKLETLHLARSACKPGRLCDVCETRSNAPERLHFCALDNKCSQVKSVPIVPVNLSQIFTFEAIINCSELGGSFISKINE